MSETEIGAGIKDGATIAIYHGFFKFFDLAHRKLDHPKRTKRRFPGGYSIEVEWYRILWDPSIEPFGIYVKSDEDELVRFAFDEKGLRTITIDNAEITIDRWDLPDNRDFARMSGSLTQWVMECFQDGEYQPLPEEIRERIVEFAQIPQIESQKQHSGLSP